MTRHTKKWKEAQLEELKKDFSAYPVIGFVDLSNCPANLLQNIRKKLSEESKISVSKTRVIKKALEGSEIKEKEKILELLQGSVGLVFTKKDPFELYSIIKKNRVNMPIKEGMVAEEDIVVPEGDTGLPPGPLLSSLKGAQIPAKIEGASIKVMEDFVAVKKGEAVTAQAVEAFATLNLKPLKVGLNVRAAYEKGQLFPAEVLDIDLEEFEGKLMSAYNNAFNLAFNICYTTANNIELLLQKAFREAKEVAIEGNVLNKATVEELLAKAERQAKALEEALPEQPAAEEKKEETTEEKKKEVKEESAEEKKEKGKEKETEEEAKSEGKEGAKPEEKKEEAAEEKEEKKEEEKPKEEKTEEKKEEEKPKEEKTEEKKEEEKSEEKAKPEEKKEEAKEEKEGKKE